MTKAGKKLTLINFAHLNSLFLEDPRGAATNHHQASLYEVDGFDEGGPKKPILDALGLERDLEFINVSDAMRSARAVYVRSTDRPHLLRLVSRSRIAPELCLGDASRWRLSTDAAAYTGHCWSVGGFAGHASHNGTPAALAG